MPTGVRVCVDVGDVDVFDVVGDVVDDGVGVGVGVGGDCS